MMGVVMDDFILRALLAGLLVVMVAGPMGCVVVWRRMAYFGDALAHAALLGTALAILFDIAPLPGVILVGSLISYLLLKLQVKKDLSNDAILGILSHGALAAGLILLAYMQSQGKYVNLMGYLFGDVLSVSNSYLIWLAMICLGIVLVLWRIWSSMLAIAVHEELARSEGVAVDRVRLLFMLLMAGLVAVAMKVVGIILITALLIVPAASARRFARSPESMAIYSVVLGMLAVVSGLLVSLQWDAPAGPAIVLSSVVLFFMTRLKAAV